MLKVRFEIPKRTPPKIDLDRARKSGSLVGDPIIAPAGCNYPEGEIVDHACLVCGMCLASHGDSDVCWRAIVPKWKLLLHDYCERIVWWVEG